MTRPAGIVICVCAHIEHRKGEAPCSSCGRAYSKRVTPGRLAAIRAVAANPRAAIKDRVVRKACIDLRLLAVVRAAPPNNTGRHRKDPPWELSVTLAGTAVLAAVRAHEVARAGADRALMHGPKASWEGAECAECGDVLVANEEGQPTCSCCGRPGERIEELAELTPEEDALLREIASAPPRKIVAKS